MGKRVNLVLDRGSGRELPFEHGHDSIGRGPEIKARISTARPFGGQTLASLVWRVQDAPVSLEPLLPGGECGG
jgi:hypothetical protein